MIYRFDAGKIVESWIQVDRLAALEQFSVLVPGDTGNAR